MTKRKRKIVVIMALLAVPLVLAGCFGGSNEALEEDAVEYVTAVVEHDWATIVSKSTGSQLSKYMQMLPLLNQVEMAGEVKKIEVLGVIEEGDISFVSIHFTGQYDIPGYGSAIDDKHLLLHMKEVDDSDWRVFEMSIVDEVESVITK